MINNSIRMLGFSESNIKGTFDPNFKKGSWYIGLILRVEGEQKRYLVSLGWRKGYLPMKGIPKLDFRQIVRVQVMGEGNEGYLSLQLMKELNVLPLKTGLIKGKMEALDTNNKRALSIEAASNEYILSFSLLTRQRHKIGGKIDFIEVGCDRESVCEKGFMEEIAPTLLGAVMNRWVFRADEETINNACRIFSFNDFCDPRPVIVKSMEPLKLGSFSYFPQGKFFPLDKQEMLAAGCNFYLSPGGYKMPADVLGLTQFMTKKDFWVVPAPQT